MNTRIAVAAALLATAPIHAASAEPDPNAPTMDSGADDRGFWGAAEENSDQQTPHVGSGATDPSDSPVVGPQIILGNTACAGAESIAAAGTLDDAGFCAGVEPAQDALTIGDVRNAFARLDLPAAKLVIQPPDGLTLVNFDSNFYTTSTHPITRTVTLLGQQVTLEATPSEFHWDFGDGDALTTTEPGAPYPELIVTHNYLRNGTYRPRLDTTFTGRYRVGGGAWHQIPGTVTITGTPQALRAIEAQPKLVGY